MGQAKPPLGTVIEMEDGAHHIFNGKGFVPARQGPTGWEVDAETLANMGLGGTQGGAPKLTEDQGKAQGWARMMSGAEDSYQRAVHDPERPYNPSSPRNTIAAFAEGLPKGIGEGIAAGIRDDVSDKGHQAELQWTDAQLRAQSGANAPDPEVKKYVRTYFPGVGENPKDIGGQKERARVDGFDSARVRAGAAGGVAGYGTGKPKAAGWTSKLPPEQVEAAKAFKGSRAPGGTARNPSVPTDEAEYAALPKGTYYVHYTGAIKRKP